MSRLASPTSTSISRLQPVKIPSDSRYQDIGPPKLNATRESRYAQTTRTRYEYNSRLPADTMAISHPKAMPLSRPKRITEARPLESHDNRNLATWARPPEGEAQGWNSSERLSGSAALQTSYAASTSPDDELQEVDSSSVNKSGASLWSSMITAFGAFSNSATQPEDYREPDTPIGSESRITVALKTYYLGQAKGGEDLPEWLFSAEELRAAGVGSRRKNRQAAEINVFNETLTDRHRHEESSQPRNRMVHGSIPGSPRSSNQQRGARSSGSRDDRDVLRERRSLSSQQPKERVSDDASDTMKAVNLRMRRGALPRNGLPSHPSRRRDE